MPDDLLDRAKQEATRSGVSLKQFFVAAVEEKLMPKKKVRRDPPAIGDPNGPKLQITREQIDEAMFG